MIILSDFMRLLLEKTCPHHVMRVEYTLVCTKVVAYHRLAKIDKTFPYLKPFPQPFGVLISVCLRGDE